MFGAKFRNLIRPGVLSDSPELRAVASLAGVDPTRVLEAFNDPEQFNEHCSAAELSKFADALSRLTTFARSMPAVIDVALARDQAHKAKEKK